MSLAYFGDSSDQKIGYLVCFKGSYLNFIDWLPILGGLLFLSDRFQYFGFHHINHKYCSLSRNL